MGRELLGAHAGLGVERAQFYGLPPFGGGAVGARGVAPPVAVAEADDGEEDGQGQGDGDTGHQDEHQLVTAPRLPRCAYTFMHARTHTHTELVSFLRLTPS